MPPPLLAIAWRLQQLLNEVLPSLRRSFCNECLRCLRSRWQAGEIVMHAANESASVSRWIGIEAFRFEVRDNEGIDRIRDLCACFDSRWSRLLQRLEGPVGTIFVRDLKLAPHCSGWRIARRPRCSHFHPSRQISDLSLVELLLWRHLKVLVRPAHRLDEQTRVGITRNDGRARVTTFEDARTTIQQEPAFDLVRAHTVAVVTPLRQHRTDAFFKELDICRGRLCGIKT